LQRDSTTAKPTADGSLMVLFDWLCANVRYQRNHEQYEEDEKNDLRESSKCNSHSTETNCAGDDSDKKKH
jgi:hypothetical protein